MGGVTMLFLHLSDIHFQKKDGGPLDQNAWLRNEIHLDLQAELRRLGAARIDAILVSGDIAFSAQEEEYAVAQSWLKKLCEIGSCDLSDVFMCPGNHDIIRKEADGPIVQTFHRAIKTAGEVPWESLATTYIDDQATRELLYGPLRNYNAFAVKYDCAIHPPSATFASRYLDFPDGSKLRLVAVNSTLVSSSQDNRDEAGFLFIDPPALNLQRAPGVAYLLICHHPPNWHKWDNHTKSRWDHVAHVQLFGHEHGARIDPGPYSTKIFAGAVHPSKSEPNWQPGYNLIQVDPVTVAAERKLRVTAHVRVMQQAAPFRFGAHRTPRGDEQWTQDIHLDPWEAPAPPVPSGIGTPATARGDETAGEAGAIIASMDRPNRKLNLRFQELDLNQKSAIAGRLKLLEDGDRDQPDFERFRRAFQRAKERSLLRELEEAVSEAEREN